MADGARESTRVGAALCHPAICSVRFPRSVPCASGQSHMTRRLGAGSIVLLLCLPAVAQAQSDSAPSRGAAVAWQPISAEGVVRASALVDSVFVDRRLPQASVGGGDFAAYLMARLGVRRFPPDFNFRVAADSGGIRIGGRVMDLPGEARSALSSLVMLLAPETRLEAQIVLLPEGSRAIHFHLDAVTVEGVAIPNGLLDPMMAEVGRQYPALTSSGRDLYVEVPSGALVVFTIDSVTLKGP